MCQLCVLDPCESTPCQNNGLCAAYKDKTGFKCTCRDRFSGTLCENSKYWQPYFYKKAIPFNLNLAFVTCAEFRKLLSKF